MTKENISTAFEMIGWAIFFGVMIILFFNYADVSGNLALLISDQIKIKDMVMEDTVYLEEKKEEEIPMLNGVETYDGEVSAAEIVAELMDMEEFTTVYIDGREVTESLFENMQAGEDEVVTSVILSKDTYRRYYILDAMGKNIVATRYWSKG